ncbi:hypothetical protein [Halobellus sp. GM3]|uniref:hypothetical protein n=1 Tax=Halobellus sp. GM3 TaxID=3458410 RepID=UPI00403DE4DD
MSDSPDYETIAALIDDLDAASAELRERAAEDDIPAVERNAKRVAAAVGVLRQNVPPELVDGQSDDSE